MPCLNQGTEEAPPNIHTAVLILEISAAGLAGTFYEVTGVKPEEIDYEQKEKLINHAEMLADGVRYTLYAGLFSGNGQDLSAGKNAWSYLQKYHHTYLHRT